MLNPLRQILGGRVRFLPAAGARLDDAVIRFFWPPVLILNMAMV